MNGSFGHFLSVLLAFSTMAAHIACACPVGAGEMRPVSEVERACHGSGKCCLQDDAAAPVSPQPEQESPCDHCNVIHPVDKMQPDRHEAAVTVHQPFLAFAPIPPLCVTPPAQRFTERRDMEGILIPPLLRDLFHSAILLLI